MTRAAVGFGGNLGRVEKTFAAARDGLAARPEIRVTALSGIYRSAAWGIEDQPDFLNAVALLETSLSAGALLDRLRAEEERAGRVRAETWGPRTLDLDLLWFGDERSDDPRLTLPHPEIARRTFVLQPLAEVASGWRHPVTGKSATRMLHELRASGGDTACVAVEPLRADGRTPEAAWSR